MPRLNLIDRLTVLLTGQVPTSRASGGAVAARNAYEAGAAAALLYSGIAMKDGLQAALALHLFILCSAAATGAIAWLFPSKSTLPETPAAGPARK